MPYIGDNVEVHEVMGEDVNNELPTAPRLEEHLKDGDGPELVHAGDPGQLLRPQEKEEPHQEARTGQQLQAQHEDVPDHLEVAEFQDVLRCDGV